jgi:alkanesulfonate monooxygenase SsuD/methylene tetrahydromethanopterin reductase-like flavin-dependent oxidoreductase (luciferase family)
LRFGFKTSPQHTTWDAVLEVRQAADDIEVFESGWTSDHFYPMHTADPSGPRLEGWITLTALAQATRRLRLGTLVTGIHCRHPAQETTTFKGRYYELTDARCSPKPVQQPHPPICIGGNGEKRTLRTAARFAQHWNFGGGTPAQFGRARDVLYRHCTDVGRDPAEILLSAQVQFNGDPGSTAAAAADLGAAGAEVAIVYLPPPHTPAVLEPVASALSALP